MSLPAAPDYFELSDYTAVLRRRWRSIAALTCLGIVLAVGYLAAALPVYSATVLIQVNALPNNANAVGGRTAGPVNMDNEGQFLQSVAVAAVVRASMHSSLSLAAIEKNIHLIIPANSTYLQVTVDEATAGAAQRWANAVARAYLYERRITTQVLIGQGIRALQTQATQLQATVERLKTLIAAARPALGAPSAAIERDNVQLSVTQLTLRSVQAHIDVAMPLYDSLTAKNSVIVGTIVSPALRPDKPSSPRKLLVLPSGLIVGLLLGLAVAFVRDRRDPRVRSARQTQRLTGLDVLSDLTASGGLSTAEPLAAGAELAFGELARQASLALEAGPHVIAIAASAPGSGGSVVAASLAAALARHTDETVLICGDVRGTAVPQLLGVGQQPGLVEVLAGSRTVKGVSCRPAGTSRLSLITPGLDTAGLAPDLQYRELRQLVAESLDDARYVVIELQSVGQAAETFVMAEVADVAIVVVEEGVTRPDDLEACVQRLGRLQTRVLGAVILRTSRPRSRMPAKDSVVRSEPPIADHPVTEVIDDGGGTGRLVMDAKGAHK